MSNGWIAVDLDGTLAKHGEGDGVDRVGDPIGPMVERVRKWLAMGITVKIFTARVGSGTEEQKRRQGEIVRAWSFAVFGKQLPVTATKDFAMLEIWDDRAVAVQSGTGKQLSPSRLGLDDASPDALRAPLGFTGK